MVLPFSQFMFSELEPDEGDNQRLHLVFATHEVFVRGHRLKRIETTMQKKQLSFVAKVSANHPTDSEENDPVIREITVVEKAPAVQHQNVQNPTG